MSDMAQTVSSIGVSGSARWQKRRSTKSRPKRSREPSMAWVRYLRLSVSERFTASSSMPKKSLVLTT